jgi:hypothetical protein
MDRNLLPHGNVNRRSVVSGGVDNNKKEVSQSVKIKCGEYGIRRGPIFGTWYGTCDDGNLPDLFPSSREEAAFGFSFRMTTMKPEAPSQPEHDSWMIQIMIARTARLKHTSDNLGIESERNSTNDTSQI